MSETTKNIMKEEWDNLLEWISNEAKLASQNNEKVGEMLISIVDVLKMLEKDSVRTHITFYTYRQYITDLLYQKPLTALTGEEEEWEYAGVDKETQNEHIHIRCNKRWPFLYRREVITYDNKKTRSYTYTDTKRSVCVNVNNLNEMWTGGIGQKLLDEMIPIEFPYVVNMEPIRIYMEKFLYHEENQDPVTPTYDTFAVMCFRKPNGEIIDVKKFFKIDEGNEAIEITKQEYFQRKKKVMERGE